MFPWWQHFASFKCIVHGRRICFNHHRSELPRLHDKPRRHNRHFHFAHQTRPKRRRQVVHSSRRPFLASQVAGVCSELLVLSSQVKRMHVAVGDLLAPISSYRNSTISILFFLECWHHIHSFTSNQSLINQR